MGKVMAGGGKTPITPMVPALQTASVAHTADCEGAPPGCHRPPSCGFVSGATWPTSCSSLSPPGASASTPTASIHAVGPDTAGQLLHRPDRIFLIEVHDLGALRPGHLQTVFPVVHGEDPACAHHESADYGELSDGAAAEDRNRVAVRDVGDVGTEVTRREDVADHDRLLVGDVFGKLDAGHAGVGDPGVFGLHAV